jgi:DNA-binding NarL/FixJ family response regulator
VAIRVVLVEDNPIVRAGLRALLDAEPEIEVTATAEDGESAVVIAAELRPDLAVLDTNLTGLSGIDTARRLVFEIPGIRVIVLSFQADRRYVESFVEAGVSGYLLKESAYEELGQAIRKVAAGSCYLGAGIEGADFF